MHYMECSINKGANKMNDKKALCYVCRGKKQRRMGIQEEK